MKPTHRALADKLGVTVGQHVCVAADLLPDGPRVLLELLGDFAAVHVGQLVCIDVGTGAVTQYEVRRHCTAGAADSKRRGVRDGPHHDGNSEPKLR